MKPIITLLIVLGSLVAFAQNSVTIAGTQFPCTESLALISPTDTNTAYGLILSVAFAKDNNRGLIIFRKQAMGHTELRPSINGRVTIHLDSGGQIELIDNGLHDYANETIFAAYYITEGDMVKLKNSNIKQIEYTETSYDGNSKDLIAENRTYIVEAVNGYEMTVQRYDIPKFLQKIW